MLILTEQVLKLLINVEVIKTFELLHNSIFKLTRNIRTNSIPCDFMTSARLLLIKSSNILSGGCDSALVLLERSL